MAVRAKFRCMSIKQECQGHGTGDEIDTVTVRLLPVQGKTGEENKSFSKWTPSGEITMVITNPEAFKQFRPSRYYYVDFSEAPE